MLFGSVVLGFGAVGFMARMPEPKMVVPAGERPSVFSSLGAPFRDRNFRQLINFLFLWNFVAQLAVPFFTVYMLTKLGMTLTWVVGLGVLSQLANVLFLRVWGPFVDQFGSKVVLSLSSSLYFLVILGWTFTTLPEKHVFTVPLLVALHMLIGIASAGINIATTTIRMKMAPQAQAMTYLTTASLAANLGAGISPLLGGAFADFFSVPRWRRVRPKGPCGRQRTSRWKSDASQRRRCVARCRRSPKPRPIRSTRCAVPHAASSKGRARPGCTWTTPSSTR